MDRIETLNRALFLKVNADSSTPAWVIDSSRLVANDVIYLVPVLLIVMWLYGDEARRNLALRISLVVTVSLVLNQIIAFVWPHPRPFMIDLGHDWLPHKADSSFPSDHMTVFGGIGVSLLFGGMKRLGLFTLALGMGVAWSRIFVGVHFPLDMLGALVVAGISYVAVSPVWQRVGDHATQYVQRLYSQLMALPFEWKWLRR